MSCGEELESVLDTFKEHLRDCTVAIYNIHKGFDAADIEVMCDIRGSMKTRLFTLSSISESIGIDNEDFNIPAFYNAY